MEEETPIISRNEGNQHGGVKRFTSKNKMKTRGGGRAVTSEFGRKGGYEYVEKPRRNWLLT